MARLALVFAFALVIIDVIELARVTSLPGVIRISFNNYNNNNQNDSAAYRKLSLGEAMKQTIKDSAAGCRRKLRRGKRHMRLAGELSPANMRATCAADCVLKRLGLMQGDGTTIPTENFLTGVADPDTRKGLQDKLDVCLAAGDKTDACKTATVFLGCIMVVENTYALATLVNVSKTINFAALLPAFDITKLRANKTTKPPKDKSKPKPKLPTKLSFIPTQRTTTTTERMSITLRSRRPIIIMKKTTTEKTIIESIDATTSATTNASTITVAAVGTTVAGATTAATTEVLTTAVGDTTTPLATTAGNVTTVAGTTVAVASATTVVDNTTTTAATTVAVANATTVVDNTTTTAAATTTTVAVTTTTIATTTVVSTVTETTTKAAGASTVSF